MIQNIKNVSSAKQIQLTDAIKKLTAILFIGTLSACVPMQVVPQANPVVMARCVFPLITPITNTKELQAKGGINISLAPNTFTCSDAVTKTSRDIPKNIFDYNETLSLVKYINSGAGGTPENYKLVETTSTPTYSVNPKKIAFRIKINNQMPRVFRGSGTVVLYNFGGKNTSIASQDYAELSNLIVPPRTEQEIVIYGPSFDSVPENTTLGIFLYDVVTKTDNAGNVVEKQNFEWFYNYKTQVKEVAKEIVISKAWVRR